MHIASTVTLGRMKSCETLSRVPLCCGRHDPLLVPVAACAASQLRGARGPPQQAYDSNDGMRFCQRYHVDTFPLVAIIDPRTGEMLQRWRGFVDSATLAEKCMLPALRGHDRMRALMHSTMPVTDFLGVNSMDGELSAGRFHGASAAVAAPSSDAPMAVCAAAPGALALLALSIAWA